MNTNDEIMCDVIVVLAVRENMKLLASHRVLTVVEKVPLSSRRNYVSK